VNNSAASGMAERIHSTPRSEQLRQIAPAIDDTDDIDFVDRAFIGVGLSFKE
jgi:hypothetical protein